MSPTEAPDPQPDVAAPELRASSGAGEFIAFLRDNKKWWLIPLVASLLLFAGLLLLSNTAASPYVYTLF